MSWLKKISQEDLRPDIAWGSNQIACPACGYYIYRAQKYPNCPGCKKPTDQLAPYENNCPGCGTLLTTGKWGDCKCGWNWTKQVISLNDKIDKLYAPRPSGDMLQEARELGARTVSDLTGLSYDKLKEKTKEWTRYELHQLPAYREGTPEKIEKRLWNREMGEWVNSINSVKHRLDYEYIQLPPEVVRWIQYMIDEYEHDREVANFQNYRKQQDEKDKADYDKRMRETQNKVDQLSKLIWQTARQNSWPGWEDATEKDAYDTAERFFMAQPQERGQFRPEIRELARKITTQKQTPVSQYFMEPEEVKALLSKINDVDFELLPLNELLDIISKTVGIIGNPYEGDPTWNEDKSHPGLGARELGLAGTTKVLAMEELRKRLRVANKMELRRIYDQLDVDLRPIFFKQID